MNCEYMRASCEYQTQNGAIVASTAAIQPVRRLKTTLPTQYMAGTRATPAISDGSRTANSDVPKTRTVTQRMAWWSGGWTSVVSMSWSIFPNGIWAWVTLIASSTQRPRDVATRTPVATTHRPTIAEMACADRRAETTTVSARRTTYGSSSTTARPARREQRRGDDGVDAARPQRVGDALCARGRRRSPTTVHTRSPLVAPRRASWTRITPSSAIASRYGPVRRARSAYSSPNARGR